MNNSISHMCRSIENKRAWEAVLPVEQNPGAQEVPFRSLAAWVAQIKGAFAQRKSEALTLAKLVYAAKRELRFGQWSELWRQSGRMGFSKRTGEMLAVIGRGLGSLDAQNSSHLPSAWNTLYYLAQLDTGVLVDLIRREKIHPALPIKEARALLAFYKPESRGRSRRSQVKRRLSNFTEFLRTTLPHRTAGERETASLGFLQFVEEISSYANAPAVQHDRRADFESAVSPISNRQGEKTASDINMAVVPEPHSSPRNGSRCLVSASLDLLKLRPQPSL